MTSIAEHPIPDDIDIVMTHGPPREKLDLVPKKGERHGCDALLHTMNPVRPLMHCFGHIHEGYWVEVKEWDTDASGAKSHARRNESRSSREGDGDGTRRSLWL